MTPKEKAKDLFNKMESQTYSYQPYAGAHYSIEEIGWEAGKKCALIAVDEIIQAMDNVMLPNPFKQYWNKVKQEIEAL